MAAKNVKKLRDVRAAFMAQVDKSGACWEWTGRKDPDGYGQFSSGVSRKVGCLALPATVRFGEGMRKALNQPSHCNA